MGMLMSTIVVRIVMWTAIVGVIPFLLLRLALSARLNSLKRSGRLDANAVPGVFLSDAFSFLAYIFRPREAMIDDGPFRIMAVLLRLATIMTIVAFVILFVVGVTNHELLSTTDLY